jgi:subtilisin family serine protease
MIGINVLLNQAVSDAALADLNLHGQVLDLIPEINAVTLRAHISDLPAIQALPYVAAADQDMPAHAFESDDTVPVPDFATGANMWNLDAINVTDFGAARTVAYDGEGVYVVVIDSGLPHSWRAYFPEERIASQFARGFSGGGGEQGNVSSQPETWEKSPSGHGGAVAGIILGFHYDGPEALPEYLNGVAPRATIIPIRAFAARVPWISVFVRSLVYVADLKASGALGNAPVVVNMSWGSPVPLPFLEAAINYALDRGVILVAAAGNYGEAGMGYPAAYPQVISVANASWVRCFPEDDPSVIEWILRDVPESDPAELYLLDDSSREIAGQELDLAAPGQFAPVPWSFNGQVDYSFFGGTSAAAPHVVGVAALMLQKNPTLTQSQIENILKSTALPLAPGCADIRWPANGPGNPATWGDHNNVSFFDSNVCWESNATGAGLLQADAALAATPLP